MGLSWLFIALALAGEPSDESTEVVPGEGVARADGPPDHFRTYFTGLPTPYLGSIGLGFAYLPAGQRKVAPLAGVEVAVAWFFDSPIPSLAAYGGARFVPRPDARSAFVAEVAVGGLGSLEFFDAMGRVAVGVRRSGSGLHWDALLSAQVLAELAGAAEAPIVLPALEVGVAF